jgi:hypothetical protein
MPIHFRCTTCNKLLSIARRKGGQSIDCPVCGASIRVPEDILPHPQQNAETSSPPPISQDFIPPIPSKPGLEIVSTLEANLESPDSGAPPEAFAAPTLLSTTSPSETEYSRVREPSEGNKTKSQVPTPSKSKSPSSSILEMDPEAFFGSSRTTIPKVSINPKPGILEEMYTESRSPSGQSVLEELKETLSTEMIGEKPSKPSWKLIGYGALMIFGFLVAAFIAWKLVFSTPS